jgi:hypothetical protein
MTVCLGLETSTNKIRDKTLKSTPEWYLKENSMKQNKDTFSENLIAFNRSVKAASSASTFRTFSRNLG